MKTSTSSLLLKELSILLKSGLSLPKALELISRQNKEASSKILEIKEDIERGEDLVKAFRKSKLFPEFVCEMFVAVYSGEALEKILSKASDILNRMEEFKTNIINSLIYPFIVIGFSIISVFVVIEFIVPKLRKILLGFGKDLPFLTKILLWVAKFLGWFFLLGIPILLLVGVWWIKKRGWIELHRVFLKLPIIGKLWLYFDLSRWSYTTALLLESGIVLPKAISVGKNSCYNIFLREMFQNIVLPVEEGKSLSAELKNLEFIPEFLIELVSVGEETGTLPEMLYNASELLVKEADYLINRTLRWIEPLTILIIGIIVAYIVISVILPIMEISTAVKF